MPGKASAKTATKSASKKEPKTKYSFTAPTPEYVQQILDILWETYPDARTALTYDNPLELLVATILSAQCTDERVNKVTKVLFERYKTTEDYADCDIEELKDIIRSTGFFNQKAKYIKEMAATVIDKHNGTIPKNMEELTKLPGVARKTANVLLSSAFGITAGVVVDTHVKRVSYRLGLTDKTDPDKVEQDLMQYIPEEKWIFVGDSLIYHGRKYCDARKPDCENCPINKICPKRI
ncbi:MAG: endonuclease III [Firmicutes bacterium]|nr:endonuclease III [Bacillota bacterium]